MRLVLFLVSVILFQSSFSQQVVDVSKQDVHVGSNTFFVSGGEPFVTTKFVNLVEGSPYFKDEWLKGLVVDKSDHEYKNISLKIDLLNNSIHYLDENEREFIAKTPVKEIVLTDTFANNYRFIHSSGFENVANAGRDKWYLWLASGTASLYKKFEKDLSEIKPYGSATVEQRIKTREKYLLLYKNSFVEVKKIKDIPSILANKKKELEAYLETRDDEKESMDDRMAALVEYYNSLIKEQKS